MGRMDTDMDKSAPDVADRHKNASDHERARLNSREHGALSREKQLLTQSIDLGTEDDAEAENEELNPPAHRADGRLVEAVHLVQKLTQCDPLREDAVRQAMLLRFESGDRAGALAEFETFERRLDFELGVLAKHLHLGQAECFGDI